MRERETHTNTQIQTYTQKERHWDKQTPAQSNKHSERD